ncbi:MAG: hypothetical protein CO095_08545 [Armatimonadetes bacterium CG_4_9_14_3_um_filter_58_7]|nr:MAG: hypothetical protein CO095_08545 [Armatimonadetes bacterium CG_4_9_14_3_um_filter_58_7]
MPGIPGHPSVEQGYKVASRSVTLDNNPIILKGPEPVRTVCDPPAPGNPGPGNCREEVVSPVTGTVTLQAVVQEKKGWYPDIYVAGEKVVNANFDNWATINNVEFRASDILVGYSGVGPDKLDPDYPPTSHTYKVNVPWNSATMASCSVPVWADGNHPLNLSASCGASVSGANANVAVKNEGGIFGEVKDAVSGDAIVNANIEITCTNQAGDQLVPVLVTTTTSDASGVYSVDLYPGHYGIKVTEDCHVTSNLGMTVEPAQLIPLDLTLQPCLTITANPESIAADGHQASAIRVTLVDQQGHPQTGSSVNLTTTSGTFTPDPDLDTSLTLLIGSSGEGYWDKNEDGDIDNDEPIGTTLYYSHLNPVGLPGSAIVVATAPTGCLGWTKVNFLPLCGPDVTSWLAEAMTRIDQRFANAAAQPGQQECLCQSTSRDLTAEVRPWSWDIVELQRNEVFTNMDGWWHCPEGIYRGTVTVDGKCFHGYNVNYVMYGRLTKNCYDVFGPLEYSKESMLLRVYAWKASQYGGDSAIEAGAWAAAGWDGWPASAPSPEANLDTPLNCGAWNGLTGDGELDTQVGFTLRWGDPENVEECGNWNF